MTTTDPLGLRPYLLDDGVARWADAFLATLTEGREVPLYGSPEWHAEPDYRLQVAAAVRAGEAWRRDCLFLPQRLADEVSAHRHLALCEMAEAFGEAARTMAKSPTWAELQRRRGWAA
jgi:hypothetical protein